VEAAVAEVVDAAEDAVVVAAKSDWIKLPDLGVGLGYRTPFRHTLFPNRSSVDFLEVIADHYFEASPHRRTELDLLRSNFHLIPHGLALSLGSAEGLDSEYLKLYCEFVNQLKPAWCSDHIAFTRAGGIDIGHLTPLPKTRGSLAVLRENIRTLKDMTDVPVILENITETIRFPEDEFSDAEFLGKVCDDNDVGLLLDVTNLFINSVNHRFDPLKVLERLPKERVIQLHFVGGHIEGDKWIDSHSQSTQEEIWQLLSEVVSCIAVRGIILERDEHIPPVEELVPELNRARTILRNSQAMHGHI